jgi:hypothetical protein
MLTTIRDRRGPAWFFTGQSGCWCCSTAETTVVWFYGVQSGAVPIRDTDSYVEDTWTSKTDGPTPARSQCASASIETNPHIWGGFASVSPFFLTELQKFVHSTDTWSTKSAMTSHRSSPAGVTISGKAYSVYGNDSSFIAMRTNYQYTASSDSWATKTDGPTPARYQCVAFAIDAYGYFCGGYDTAASSFTKDNDQYDPSADSWTSKTDISEKKGNGAAFNQDGTGVYACGQNGSGTLAAGADLYDATANSWSSGPAIAVPRYYTTGNTASNAAPGFVASGRNSSGVAIDNTDKLNLVSGAWTNGTVMPAPKRWFSTATGAS